MPPKCVPGRVHPMTSTKLLRHTSILPRLQRLINCSQRYSSAHLYIYIYIYIYVYNILLRKKCTYDNYHVWTYQSRHLRNKTYACHINILCKCTSTFCQYVTYVRIRPYTSVYAYASFFRSVTGWSCLTNLRRWCSHHVTNDVTIEPAPQSPISRPVAFRRVNAGTLFCIPLTLERRQLLVRNRLSRQIHQQLWRNSIYLKR